MPYVSDKQRKYMHAKHPEIAAKWDEEIRKKKKKRKVGHMGSVPMSDIKKVSHSS
jgi:hypothetical protein